MGSLFYLPLELIGQVRVLFVWIMIGLSFPHPQSTPFGGVYAPASTGGLDAVATVVGDAACAAVAMLKIVMT